VPIIVSPWRWVPRKTCDTEIYVGQTHNFSRCCASLRRNRNAKEYLNHTADLEPWPGALIHSIHHGNIRSTISINLHYPSCISRPTNNRYITETRGRLHTYAPAYYEVWIAARVGPSPLLRIEARLKVRSKKQAYVIMWAHLCINRRIIPATSWPHPTKSS
jgi:hypothetical protein